jgi:hypothetical protein
MKVTENMRLCKGDCCPDGREVCCADCVVQDTCKYEECCWEDPKTCGSCKFFNICNEVNHNE